MRYSESQPGYSTQLDFVPRHRRAQITQVIIACIIATLAIFVLHFAVASGSTLYGAIGSVMVVALLGFFVVYRKQQNLDLVMTTEYQNMLFAQAASQGSILCLIVRRDGTIVYANDGLRTLFPNAAYGDAQSLTALFEQGGVLQPDRERFENAMASGKGEKVVFALKNKEGISQDYILTLQPLARPAGFVVIRAREYKDTRAGTQVLPDLLRATTVEKLDHLLSKTPCAHYVTDAFGGFEYVNPAFEQLLGYEPGDLRNNKATLRSVLYQLNRQAVSDDYTLADFRGEALLTKRNSELANVLLNQTLMRDAGGKVTGATGSVLPIAARPQ